VTLRLRLLLLIALGLLASLAVAGTFAFWHAVQKAQTELQAALAVGSVVARHAVDDIREAADPQRRLVELIAGFDGDRHLRASLVDAAGNVLATSNLQPPDDPMPAWIRAFLPATPAVLRIALPAGFERYGTVVLTTDAASELSEAWGDFTLTVAVLAIFGALVFALVYLTLSRTLGPLQDLNRAFTRIGQGDYDPRVKETGPVEFARLARGFNRMAERLSAMKSQNDQLNQRLAAVQEKERADLARDLHDEIGPLLFAASLDIATVQQSLPVDAAARVAPRLQAVRDAVTHMQQHLKEILRRLRPTVLEDMGLAGAVDGMVAFWRVRHPHVVFDVDLPPRDFGEPLDGMIYRIINESTSNALRHGRPGRIEIAVRLGGEHTVTVNVADDGGGMDEAAAGFGITGMRERVALLGGTLTIRNRPEGNGVTVSARVPLDRQAHLEETVGE
jgi:two-component system, NarL family, sensor histidine kinase UhpB